MIQHGNVGLQLIAALQAALYCERKHGTYAAAVHCAVIAQIEDALGIGDYLQLGGRARIGTQVAAAHLTQRLAETGQHNVVYAAQALQPADGLSRALQQLPRRRVLSGRRARGKTEEE
jgi:hypothetical protein